ncbi:putative quinol monooxygenase [Marinoscillum sp.]|uniref:putative quinol monooxygenase n=1 Tax=Marinoscillum sp. TaxID=2024838 RepID=UPI003BA921CB
MSPLEILREFQDHEDLVVRLAKLEIDSTRLTEYESFLTEEIKEAVAKEPGVLTMYAVQDQTKPHHVTIMEIYANDSAYQAHLNTPHFLKYKNGTREMVNSLELIDLDPIVFGVRDN